MAKTFILFDLDGTLCESRELVSAATQELLLRLLREHVVGIVSGCSLEQMCVQLPLASCQTPRGYGWLHLFPAAGTEHYRAGDLPARANTSLVSDATFRLVSDAVHTACADVDVLWDSPYGTVLERRGGIVVFAALGKDAPLSLKVTWDTDRAKRMLIRSRLLRLLPDMSVTVGGTTSIDIAPSGVGKDACLGRIQELGHSPQEVLFVADALFDGGNDAPVRDAGIDSVSVSSVAEAQAVMETLCHTTQPFRCPDLAAVYSEWSGRHCLGTALPTTEYIVARDANDRIVGALLLTPIDDPVFHRRWGLVENVFVSSRARRRGYGRLLMQRAEHLGAILGCEFLKLTSRKDEGKGLYRSLGYVEGCSYRRLLRSHP